MEQLKMTFTREAASPMEVDAICASFTPRELSALELSARNSRNSRALARKAQEYRSAGNEKMATVCEIRANAAFERSLNRGA